MQRVKRRIFSGVVCEQEVYTVSDRANIKKAEPRPRFKDDEERAQHRIGISKRKHQRLVNENFSPLSLYSTLTFDDDALRQIAKEALKRKTGARGLRSIIEGIMRNVMYDVPSIEGVTACRVTKDVITSKKEPILTVDKDATSADKADKAKVGNKEASA